MVVQASTGERITIHFEDVQDTRAAALLQRAKAKLRKRGKR